MVVSLALMPGAAARNAAWAARRSPVSAWQRARPDRIHLIADCYRDSEYESNAPY
ncbi:hypothetical protein [Nocardia sp. NPDC059239]|uniref:hypothetical protein n=1 Tax=Nocardia sp. NPDC059239 TaxID=3346785 RepID=UPI00369B3788